MERRPRWAPGPRAPGAGHALVGRDSAEVGVVVGECHLGEQRGRRLEAGRVEGAVAAVPSWAGGQARRYRQTAMGANTASSRADHARARTTSLLDPRISDRTACTIGEIGWYFANGWSQPGIELAGT